MSEFDKGDTVQWNWGSGTASGRITKIYHQKVTRTISGTEVTRNASDDAPAYLIEQSDGSDVLKSHSEVERVD